ncbi:hypothetical protein [Methylobacterium haplocladii]|uniref:Uncharacterized protein n=1 Tax=Methylobacterium haplocladii TaxID=1176176 RepID=A0A512ITX6_9HYPH|nr:hypothetical protein [Methylobacterium haplocladii]GEP01158.1 hypothetical protein MHA02_35450 [Methylobacterium haplocladii]GJD82882.1 hypothetical protein HPGCJGGD_0744 [Methylobacterium haplocladii]GLS59017.1 hypothetical protein GCM10007887_16830 [Methylobacterium haplocladii]
MTGSEENRLEQAAALIAKACDLSRAQGSYRLRILMDMVALELGREIARLSRRASDSRGDGPGS